MHCHADVDLFRNIVDHSDVIRECLFNVRGGGIWGGEYFWNNKFFSDPEGGLNFVHASLVNIFNKSY